ncbi:hypothetical protein [uncultured Xylophilus sp.]|uniref:hypothetical protein n=1 Tax=uncultured Xylophilus sp. TaxID=296832 RepID=UPI0025D3328D|nr:hypothetical protein [uncultured Xylophilus sp.]
MSTRAPAWVAAGVRHEILMRVLPALRHDMAGPLSVARMGNTVLKRYMAAQPFDPEQSHKRLEQTEEQLNQLLVAIRTLNRWDLDTSERADAAPAVRAGLELARPMLDLHGIAMDAVPEDATPADWPAMSPARALYAVIGVASCLQDTATGPAALSVRCDGSDLLFTTRPRDGAAADEPQFPARRMKIDADALSTLLADLQWPADIAPGTVRLRRPDDGR